MIMKKYFRKQEMFIINKEKIFFFFMTIYIISMYAFPEYVLISESIFFIVGMFCIKKIKINFWIFWSILLLIFYFISNLRTSNLQDSTKLYFYIFKNLSIGYILICNIFSITKIERIMKLYIYGGILLALKLFYIFPTSYFFKYRLNIPEKGFNANTIGYSFAISFSFLLYFILVKKEKKIWNYLLGIILLVMIIFTESRITFLLVIGNLFGLIILTSRSKIKTCIKILVLLILFLILGLRIEIIREKLFQRIFILIEFLSGNNVTLDGSASIRKDLVLEGLKLIPQKLFLGYGLGEFTSYSKWKLYSHNNYIELLVSSGIVGFFSYYLMYFYLLILNVKFLFRKKKIIYPFLINSFLLFLLELGHVSYYDRFWSLFLCLNFIVVNVLLDYKEYSCEKNKLYFEKYNKKS